LTAATLLTLAPNLFPQLAVALNLFDIDRSAPRR
jgi:hypothetical protein